jgi:hypothetical protein
LIETDEYFLEACRYTVLNPVRAQLCETPEEWRWSNFRSTAGLARVPEWLDVEHTLRCFSADSTVARERYAEFVWAGAASRDGLLVVA